MTWLLIRYDNSQMTKVIVITGNIKKLQQYIVDNVEKLYDPYFKCIIDNEHYESNNNKLTRYVGNFNTTHDEIIAKIREFYQKFPKKITKTLKYVGDTYSIKISKCDDVTYL